jgi:hypothetical protein
MFAFDLLLVAKDGNNIFHAKFRRSKKLMFIALRRKPSASCLTDSVMSSLCPVIPKDWLR